MISVSEFIAKLKQAHDVPNYYNNHFPYNCGFYDGSRYSWDCWNLIKTMLAVPSWEDTKKVGSYVSPKNFVTGDCDGYHLLMKCTERSKDFSKLSIPGTYLYLSTSPHAGVYVGEFVKNGYTFNVVECTGAWESKVQYTYVDKSGNRYQYKGGPKSKYSWTDYGLLTPYVDYGAQPTPEPTFSAFAIDVSRYQTGLSLAEARKEGFDHIVMRAGGGGNYADPTFNDFCNQATVGDWKKAAYYYGNCYSVDKALSEAEHFKSLLAGNNIHTVFYDVEGNMLNQDKQTLTSIILAFCNTLKAAGYNCGIYSSESHFNSKFDDAKLSGLPHWVAKYSQTPPVLNSGNKVIMWQYGGEENPWRSNKVAGIVTDQNIMLEEWDEEKSGFFLNGYDYSPVFDPKYYSGKYADLKAAFGDNAQALWNHFVTFGMNEFRQASEGFNPVVYRDSYEDLRNAFGDNNPMYYFHYVAFGINEGRSAV